VRTCDVDAARAAAVDAFGTIEREEARRAYVPPTPDQERKAGAMRVAFKLGLLKCSNLAAQRWGARWNMDEAEATAIADPLVEVVERLIGSVSDDPYTRCALAIGMYAAPRILDRLMGGDGAAIASALRTDAPATAPVEPRDVEHVDVQTSPVGSAA
jgi:hypothetical protein